MAGSSVTGGTGLSILLLLGSRASISHPHGLQSARGQSRTLGEQPLTGWGGASRDCFDQSLMIPSPQLYVPEGVMRDRDSNGVARVA
jgi:hypothetical protein